MKRSTDTAMINGFILDTSRIQQQIIINQRNYVNVLYDRVIANHASINSRREGTPKQYVNFVQNLFSSQDIYIQIILDASKDSQSYKYYIIHEASQGSESAGNAWICISIPLIKTIKDTSLGWTSTNPNNNKKWKTHMSGFVDGTRDFVTLPNKYHKISLELCELLQYAAQSQEHLLYTL